jgi:hypothetical protein
VALTEPEAAGPAGRLERRDRAGWSVRGARSLRGA